MILIGQYDSPFVRRVGIALQLYAMPYEHRPWSAFADAERLRAINPLGRVPTLITEDGTVLMDSFVILDHLDSCAGEAALMPPSGPDRTRALRRIALAMGVAEKAVALVYESRFHDLPSAWAIERMRRQITGTLTALAGERTAQTRAFWHGETPGHADIALGCAVRFLANAHPDLTVPAGLAEHSANCEALASFQAVQQAFQPPSKSR